MQTSSPFTRFIPRLAGLALLLGTACGEDVGPNYDTGCGTTNVTVTVSAGVVPQFNWTPNCAIWELSVTAATAPTEQMWHTGTFAVNELLPPITYGVHPANANQNPPPVATPLQPGIAYKVTVYVTSDALDFRTAGEKTFTP